MRRAVAVFGLIFSSIFLGQRLHEYCFGLMSHLKVRELVWNNFKIMCTILRTEKVSTEWTSGKPRTELGGTTGELESPLERNPSEES